MALRRYLILALLALLSTIGVACGASPTPTPSPEPTSTPTPTPTATPIPTPTQTLAPVATAALPAVTLTPADEGNIALVGGTIYRSPDTPPIPNGIVLVRDGLIAAVGEKEQISIPPDVEVVDTSGLIVTAGFWNSPVHFLHPKWQPADALPAAQLAGNLRDMLTRYGFVRVVDTGSVDPRITPVIRRRIESGEVAGPSIIMIAGGGFVPKDGQPFYLPPQFRLPEITDPGLAGAMIDEVLDQGYDAIKLFTASPVRPGFVVVMPVDVVRAATAAAHQRGKLVIAHPQSSAGAEAAIDGGVDVLAHTFPDENEGPWDRSLPLRMKQEGMALIPTIKLWKFQLERRGAPPDFIDRRVTVAQEQLRAFADADGQILFGTDIGCDVACMTNHDPTDEYVYMEGAGLSFAQILASLTTAPAQRFGVADRVGRIDVGMEADLVVLKRDPERDIRALAEVRYTIRHGHIIYEAR